MITYISVIMGPIGGQHIKLYYVLGIKLTEKVDLINTTMLEFVRLIDFGFFLPISYIVYIFNIFSIAFFPLQQLFVLESSTSDIGILLT